MNERHVRTGSFEVEHVTATAAGVDCIGVATAANRVEFLTPDGRTSVTLDTPVDDLALGDRAYALCDGAVVALSYEGTRVWRVGVDAARALDVLASAGVVVVLRGSSLVGLDAETGGERFRTDRPHADVAEVPGLVAAGDRACLSAWSFLSVFDAGGAPVTESNLAGAIDHVGVLEDVAIAAMKDGRLVGTGLDDGERRFEVDHDASWLAPRGEEALFCVAGDDLVHVGTDGSIDRVGDAPGGTLVVSADGTVACVVGDGTVDVYRTRGNVSALEATLETETLSTGDAVEVRFRNAGESTVTAAPTATGSGATYGSLDHVTLRPGEKRTLAVPVRDLEPDAPEATLRLACDGSVLLEATLSLEGRSDARAVAAEPTRIVDGEAVVELAIEAGSQSERGLRIEPGGVSIPAVPPAERETNEVRVPLGTEALDVEGDDVSESVPIAVPTDPLEVDVAVEGGFVEVWVTNVSDVPLEDHLRVEASWLPDPVERSLSLAAGSTLGLALPALEAGQHSVELECGAATATRAVEVETPLDLGDTNRVSEPDSIASTRRDRSKERGRRGLGEESVTHGATAEGSPPRTESASNAGPSSPDPGTDVDTASNDTGAAAPAANDAIRDAEEPKASFAADRKLSKSSVEQHRAVVERIRVENGQRVTTEVTLADREGEQSLGRLDPGETCTALRWHTFSTPGEHELSEITIHGDTTAQVSPETVAVEPASVEFALEFVSGETGGELRLEASNEGSDSCVLGEVRLRGFEEWIPVEDVEVAPGESVAWTTDVDGTPATDDVVEAFLRYALDGETGEWGTLARVVPSETGLDDVTVTVHDETEFVDGWGSLALTVTNDGRDTIEAVGIEVEGDAVDEYLRYEREKRERFEPGDSFVHEVPLRTDADDLTLPVTLSATIDGETLTDEFRVAGPIPDEEWTETVQRAWKVYRESKPSEESLVTRLPPHLAGEFQREG